MLFDLRRALVKGSFLFLAIGFVTSARAAELAAPRPLQEPKVAPASNEGELAMKGMQLPPGFKVELFAAEPHLANPVAFDIDRQNRFWVAETFRLHAGVTDIRGKNAWLDEDLAARTVNDRLAMMKRHEGENFPSYEENSERLKLILDTDSDGRADKSTVFAEGFNSALDGIASGVLARDGKVYFANIPNLWLLRDTNDDGVADERKSLHYGFGVRVGFLGHDLHGLIMGPDGKLYFSIGDRGSSIEFAGKRIGQPDTGCVFRCDPDGGDLEVFAYGLRNPQELAFDQYGNLFTGDNNSDGGDRARLVHLVEGGDSGWRIGFQFIERPVARGPWNDEKMWHPQNPDQPAFLVPPIANLTDGPSGFAFYPGTGLTDQYRDHFFLVDFHGGRSSGIHSFSLAPEGAGFQLRDPERFVWNALPTDVAFGPEGGIYFSDWVQGWGLTGKGRVYRLFNPEALQAPIIAETKRLLNEGMGERGFSDLRRLLAHADMRVRQDAQFELVARGPEGLAPLRSAANGSASQLGRLHAIWGLAQLARGENSEVKHEAARMLRALAADEDAEVRAQIAKAIGDARIQAPNELAGLLADPWPRARMFAAISASKFRDPAFIAPVIKLLAENQDSDPQLRHAGSLALAGIQEMPALDQAARHPSPSVRLGALLALRRLERAEIAVFLNDDEPRLILEAARAINDLPIGGAMTELAGLGKSARVATFRPELLRRIVNANYRNGTRAAAQALADLASNDRLPPEIRAESLDDLATWERPSGRDRVTGLWRPVVGPRFERHAVEAIEPNLAALLREGPDAVRAAAAELAGRARIASAADALTASIRSSGSSAPRVAALRALAALDDPRLAEMIEFAQNDSSEELRKAALRFQSRLKPSGALEQIQKTLDSGTVGEKQSALATLGTMSDKAASNLLFDWLEKLDHEQVPDELQLDVLDAAAQQQDPALKAKLETVEKNLSRGGDLAPFRVTLHGGNAVEGRRIFFERPDTACVRCHKIAGQVGEGGEVGPDLTHIGAQKDREYLLESIVAPNKQIAQGFQSLLVATRDGAAFAGLVTSETPAELVLNSPEDGVVTIKKSDITAREPGLSSMPEGLSALLSRRELRDLIEYLSSLNTP
jgi:quinoprotein glucose dehydrogenase